MDLTGICIPCVVKLPSFFPAHILCASARRRGKYGENDHVHHYPWRGCENEMARAGGETGLSDSVGGLSCDSCVCTKVHMSTRR